MAQTEMNNAKDNLISIICKEFIDKPINKLEAKEKLRKLMDNYLIEELKTDENRYDLRLNVQRYLEEKEREGLSKNTLYSYKIQLYKFLEYIDKKVQDITIEDIKGFLIHREDNSCITLKSSMETIRGILKIFFDWLVEEKIIYDNPVNKIKPFKFDDSNIEPLETHEIELIRKACINQRERVVIEVLLSTGCRLSELTAITVNDINWESKLIRIKGKGRRNRPVLMSPDAEYYVKEYLKTRKDEIEYLFITERQPFRKLSNRAIQRILSKIHERTNIKKNVTPRVFQITFAKDMQNKGCPLNMINSLLGYKEEGITSETYVKLSDVKMNQIYNQFYNNRCD